MNINSSYKKILFKTVGYFFPLLFFTCIELILRLIGFGGDYPLTLSLDDNHQIINPKLSMRYFNTEELSPTPQYDIFLKEKDEKTCRIVVQGESTAAGFPYAHGGSFPRMLEHKLQMKYPEKNIEVINVSLAATNTYALLDVSDEILSLKPDAVILSVGHNEFYGALGVASAQAISQFRSLVIAYLKLKKLRIVQLLRFVILNSGRDDSRSQAVNATLMQRMVKEQSIPLTSHLYRRASLQYKKNLDKLIRTYRNENIPVFISTLVCNYKDQEPFSFLVNPSENSSVREQFQKGKVILMNGDYTAAKKYFIDAKEKDELRFRAPEEFNAIIKELAKNNGAYLVDMLKVFEDNSEFNIPGYELLKEHVHPNIKGYNLMAENFILGLQETGFFKKWTMANSLESESMKLLVTDIDSIYAEMLTLRLKSSWPFTQQNTNSDTLLENFRSEKFSEQLALKLYQNQLSWIDASNQLYYHYMREKQFGNALTVAQSLAQEFSIFEKPQLMAAQSALLLDRKKLAQYYFLKAYSISNRTDTALKVYSLYLKLKEYTNAKFFLSQLHDRSLSSFIDIQIQALEKILQFNATETEIFSIDNTDDLVVLGNAYATVGENEEAIKCFRRILEKEPTNLEIVERMQKLKSKF